MTSASVADGRIIYGAGGVSRVPGLIAGTPYRLQVEAPDSAVVIEMLRACLVWHVHARR